MYTSLSSNQAHALEADKCPHCGQHGHMRQRAGRTGPTVQCGACGKDVKRPRGRAFKAPVSGHASSGAQGGQAPEMEQGEAQQEQAAQYAPPDGDPLGDVQASGALESAMLAMLKPLAAKIVQAAVQQASAQAAKVAAQAAPRTTEVIVKQPDTQQQHTVTNPHPLLQEVLWRLQAGIRNFLLVGPTGSGKTTLVKQTAEALGLPYSVTPWSAGITEGYVLGRPLPDGGYARSAYVQSFEEGGVHNWDELDAADPNVPLCANSGIENGCLFVPRAKAMEARRHAQHYLFATGNTWGRGPDMLYVGRNQLDASMRSRFAGGLMFVDYARDLEAQLVPEQAYRERFWSMRDAVFAHSLRRIWGTRELLRGALLLRAGRPEVEVMQALTPDWTQDEREKVGLA